MGTHEPFVEKQFKMVNRVTYRRRNPYNTKSNKTRIVKTPGGRLVVQYLKKRASGIPCAVAGCDTKLRGIARMRPQTQRQVSKRQKTVSRAYGGSICHDCVRTRIVRAFLVEEQKVIKEKEAADKANTGKKKNKKKKGKKGKK